MASPIPPTLQETVRQLAPQRRALVAGAVVGGLLLLFAASRWAAGPQYVPLYRDLELGAVGQVTDGLQQASIPFRLEDGGTTVLVPQADVARARVLLAQDGLPATGKPGLELFDKPTWGMTDFTQRITYRRALEGELARTVGTLRGVEKAQVHLALPESSPLRRLERPAEAAVVVTRKRGMSLTPDVVQGIQYLVSNSVEQLPPENVAVMDETGRLLSMPNEGSSAIGLSSRQLELQRGVEQELARKAEEFLATAVGSGNARVQVAAQLNFEQVERTIEAFDPEGQVLQTEQRSEGQADPETGAASTVIANQYQNSKKLERVIGSVGGVKQLTVAALVNEQVLQQKAADAGTPVAAQVATLDSVLRNALGLDSLRGDRVSVIAMPFEVSAATAVTGIPADSAEAAATAATALDLAERFSRPALVLLGILVAFVLGWRALKPAAPVAAPALAGAAAGGASVAMPGPAAAEALTSPDFLAPLPPIESPQTRASLQLRQTVQAESTNRPETVAQVVSAWVKGD